MGRNTVAGSERHGCPEVVVMELNRICGDSCTAAGQRADQLPANWKDVVNRQLGRMSSGEWGWTQTLQILAVIGFVAGVAAIILVAATPQGGIDVLQAGYADVMRVLGGGAALVVFHRLHRRWKSNLPDRLDEPGVSGGRCGDCHR
jgi:hypothetical protein